MSLGLINRFLPLEQREQWNWKSLFAMLITVFGGLMIILGGSVGNIQQSNWYDFLFTYRIDWKSMGSEFTWSDAIGMGLTMFSNINLAIYMVCLRFMKNYGLKLSDEMVFLYQGGIVVVTFFIPSLVIDDWSIWLKLTGYDWFMFITFSILVYFAANWLNIIAIQALGPSTAGSILALRLVSTIIFSGIILHEWFKSIWQIFGCLIVMAAISYFIYIQNQIRKKAIQQMPIEQSEIQLEEIEVEEEESFSENVLNHKEQEEISKENNNNNK
jgi:drug/metabolite transporter (DMT)-like permease